MKTLLALMCFNFSRFDQRIDSNGNLKTMEQQDRSLWDQDLIRLGIQFIEQSDVVNCLSKYHLEVTIAMEYTIAKNFDSTDWEFILTIYDQLLLRVTNPIIELNRLVVLEKIKGPQVALDALLLLTDNVLKENHLYYSIKGGFEKKLSLKSYKESIKKAIQLTNNQKEKEFLILYGYF